MTRYVPQRGDAVWITLDPRIGREQAGRQPVLVLSAASYNGPAELMVACPITNQAKGYPFEIPIPPGLKVTGVVLADQVLCLDWTQRKIARICRIPPETVDRVVRRITTLLGGTLPPSPGQSPSLSP